MNFQEQVQGIEKVLNQNIWLNSHIRINNKVIWYKDWMNQGIKWIGDLIQENNHGERRFISNTDLATKLGFKPMFLKYHGIIQAIPAEWKITIQDNTEEEDNEEEDYKLIDKMLDSSKASKMIYSKLVKEKTIPPQQALNKWRNTVTLVHNDKEIIRSQNNQRKLVMNNKIRSFNYKFLLRNVPYEAKLHKMKIKEQENCTVCQMKEDILHLYWNCPNTRRLWERLKVLIEHNQRTPFTRNKELCLLGEGEWISKRSKEVCRHRSKKG